MIALQADGSAMYTLQALWTQAREGLDVTTLVISNRSYAILLVELARAGVDEPAAASARAHRARRPAAGLVALARGMGVPPARATTARSSPPSCARAGRARARTSSRW